MSNQNNLQLKIGTKTEAMWTRIKKEAEALIEGSLESLIIQREMLKLAKAKILEETQK